jgi:hypothetical protein
MDSKTLLEPLEALEVLKEKKLIEEEEYLSRKNQIIDIMTKSTFKQNDRRRLEVYIFKYLLFGLRNSYIIAQLNV